MKISVVVPIYNVEKYLEKCLKSIKDQSFHDLEIILVDDGSTDTSGFICDKFAEKDNRIRVVHKENGGLSDARNAGLAIATGDYICFIDSDDWIEPETLQRAAEAIKDVDIVVWGYRKESVDEHENVLHFSEHKTNAILTKDEGYHLLCYPGVLEQVGFAWNKLYYTHQLKHNGFRFEKGLSLVEDSVFNFPLFLQCNKIRFIDFIGTHYIQRKRISLGSAYYPNRMALKLRVAELMRELMSGFGAPPSIVQREYEQFIAAAFRSTVRSIAQLDESYTEKRRRMKNLLNEQIDVVSRCHAKRLIDRIIVFAARMKWVDLMIVIEGRKR